LKAIGKTLKTKFITGLTVEIKPCLFFLTVEEKSSFYKKRLVARDKLNSLLKICNYNYVYNYNYLHKHTNKDY